MLCLRDPLFKSSIYLIVTSAFSSILGFFFWIVATRFYLPNDIGITSVMFSSMSLISIVSSIGLPRALIFYLPRDKNVDKIISSCLTVNIISSIIFSLIFILGLGIWGSDLKTVLNNLRNIVIFIVITTAISASSIMSSVFMAIRRSSFHMTKETIFHFIKLLSLILFISFGSMGILLSISTGLFISIIVGFVLLSKTRKYIPRFALDPIIKKMVSFSTGNYVADIFYNLPRLVFPIIILNVLNAKSAGYFYVAITVAGLLYGISQSISSSLLVESSDKDKFLNNVNKSIKFNLVILIPGLLLFTIFGRFILNIFNPSYESATVTMLILTMTSIPLSLINIFNTVRNAQNRVMGTIEMNAIVATIAIVLSIPFIRIMNIEGVAVSYLIANTVGAIVIILRIENPKKFISYIIMTKGLTNDVRQ